ncbi:phosphoinositide-specific phospholipase C [Stachybotrys elegans]|uniref:Phosphoinositide phospholipase C n=1 Tax=Stachybotrys elegans TaxID=80388 RepID=A0A8K0WQJ5_9HYPO|nr:phosphoinositide-specific phospholipase C [Stachybotrys elegans]
MSTSHLEQTQIPSPSYSAMATRTAQLRRSRPSQVQTNFHAPTSSAHPVSAISSSSVASSSRQGSPIMSPEAPVLTRCSSIQASPEPLHTHDDDIYPSNFQLPDSILTRKTSANSLGTSLISSSGGALAEALSASTSTGGNSKTSIIRRISSRASRSITRRRRGSSAAPQSREGSVGPCLLRRRSDSNTTAPPDFPSAATDSDTDWEDKDEFGSFRSTMGLDGLPRESSSTSTNGSVSGSSSAMAGPVLPPQLQMGTALRKVKKGRSKAVFLHYDPGSNRLVWDKTHPLKNLHVDNIKELRTGSDIQQYARDFNIPEYECTRWFTIMYTVPDKNRSKVMHLIAYDYENYNTWVAFLSAMLRHRQAVMTSLMAFDDRAIAQYWQREMARIFGDRRRSIEEEELDFAGVKRVCRDLHIHSSQSTLAENFNLSDVRRRERLNFSEFLVFVRLTNQREEVQSIIHDIAGMSGFGMTQADFFTFLRDTQKEDVDSNPQLWEKTFIKFARKYRADGSESSPSLDSKDMYRLSEAGFVSFLSSKHNAPLVAEPQEYTLDRPMNEYFISSSHNTYLLGRQVAGQSSIEGYISALARGCRCVEVDCWDGPDCQPTVVHGRTMTTAISFKDTIATINKYAFVASNFPLWISLEVHCNAAQQAVMAETMKEIFGAKLVTEPLDPESDKLPSPSELMGRILIKVKKPREEVGRRRGNSLTSPLAKSAVPELGAGTLAQPIPQSPVLSPSPSGRRLVSKSRVNTITEGEVQEMLSSSTSDNESGSDSGAVNKPPHRSTIKVLGQLGVYCAGSKFAGFDSADAKKFNHIFSFMETSFARNSRTKEAKMALDLHNMRYLMRIYPDGTRVSSSNFDPLIYWRRGVQMAALNWQTFDLGMQLNQAMFQGGTDASGYVLKPTELRDIQVLPYNADFAGGKKERSVVSFSIDVLSAQQLMRPANLAANKSMDPYVEVEVFHANDKRDKKDAPSHPQDSPLRVFTEVIHENGFNPVFKEGKFKFKVTTKHPEMVFVRFSVKLSNDGTPNKSDRPPMATYTVKLCHLKQGYRTLPLLNHAGEQYLFSTLFCKLKIDPIEKTLIDAPRAAPEGRKFNRLGGKVFGRINTSPRGTMETSSMEKSSFESPS